MVKLAKYFKKRCSVPNVLACKAIEPININVNETFKSKGLSHEEVN